MLREKRNLIEAVIVFGASFLVYASLLMPGIYAGDSGDVTTASYVLGVAHPPGYPLYCLLGHFFGKLPFGPTVAWRYSLFSAFFSSLALTLFFLGVFFLTKRTIPSLVGTFVLAFSYLFWLYSEVQEVFALLAFFVISLVFLGWKIRENFSKKNFNYKFLWLWFFLAGLSLTHHHTILLLVPAFLYLFWPLKKRLFSQKSVFFKALICFLLGLSVYLYVPWAARRNPPINWDNARDLPNFIRLVTRADYGSFRAMSWSNIHFWQRLYQFKLYARLIVDYFTSIGVFLIFLGAFFLVLKKRRLFWFLTLCFLFLGPFFLFYANFPLERYFYLAIFERFLIAPNIILTVFLTFGVYSFGQLFKMLYERIFKRRFVLINLVEGFCFLLSVALFWQNFNKVDFRGNMVGSYFAEDLLNTPENDSIVFLSGDNSLFNSQYLYFVEGHRRDELALISGSRFGESYLIDYVEKNHSEISFPPKGEGFMDNFFKENSKNFPIYSNKDFGLKSGVWIPTGLLFKYYPDESVVNPDQIEVVNNTLFSKYHDYRTTLESIKASMFLKEVGSNFAVGCARVGRYFFDQKKYWIAKEYFEKGLGFDPEYPRNYFLLGMAQFNLKDCKDAEKSYLEYLSRAKEDRNIYFALSTLYRHCLNDEEEAKYYEEIYEKTVMKGLKKLEEL